MIDQFWKFQADSLLHLFGPFSSLYSIAQFLFFFPFKVLYSLICFSAHNLLSFLAVWKIFCLCSWLKRMPLFWLRPRASNVGAMWEKLEGLNLWLTSRSLSEKVHFFSFYRFIDATFLFCSFISASLLSSVTWFVWLQTSILWFCVQELEEL